MAYIVEFWQKERGDSPVTLFIKGLINNKAKKKIFRTIELLEKHGHHSLCKVKQAKKLNLQSDDLYELIIDYQGIAYRIFFVIRGYMYWLLHGFIKKSDKTPPREIEVALARARTIPF